MSEPSLSAVFSDLAMSSVMLWAIFWSFYKVAEAGCTICAKLRVAHDSRGAAMRTVAMVTDLSPAQRDALCRKMRGAG